MDFILRTINRFQSPAHDIGTETHKYHELTYKIDGSGISVINTKQYEFSPTSLCIYPKNIVHSEIATKGKNDSLVIWFEQMTNELEVKGGVYAIGKDTKKIIDRICEEYTNQDIYYLNRISNLISDLLISAYRSDNISNKESETDILGIKYIQKNYSMPLTVTDLAKMSGYTRSAYCKAFKSFTSQTPQEYILNTRIENAMYSLIYSKKNISSIATECGFYDAAQFSRLFKRAVGVTPLTYRKTTTVREAVTQIRPQN